MNKMGNKRTIWSFFMGILCLLSLVGCGRQDSLFMEIEGYPVTAEEYAIEAYDYISAAALQYANMGADVNRAEFWSEPVEGKTPMETIKEQADPVVIRNKGIQILALEYGLTEDISYEGFLADLEKENQLRKEKKEQGEVIYGPMQLTANQYYSYRQAQWEQAVEELVEQEVITVSEEELKAYYEELAPLEGKKNFRAEAMLYCWDGETEELEWDAAAMAEKDGVTEEGAAKLSQEYGIQVWVEQVSLDTRELGKEDTGQNRLWEILMPLEMGETSEGFWTGEGYRAVAKVTKKEYVPFGTFEETRDYVEQKYRELQAEAYMEERLQSFQVKTGRAYEELTYEQLRAD